MHAIFVLFETRHDKKVTKVTISFEKNEKQVTQLLQMDFTDKYISPFFLDFISVCICVPLSVVAHVMPLLCCGAAGEL